MASKGSDRDLKKQILQQAEKLFVKNGYNGTSTTEIAKKVGINQALIYYYYQSKENLLLAIIENRIGKNQHLFCLLECSTEEPFEKKIEELMRRHFTLVKSNAPLLRFILQDIAKSPQGEALLQQILSEQMGKLLPKLEEKLSILRTKGIIGNVSALQLATTIFSINLSPFVLRPIMPLFACSSSENYTNILEQQLNTNIQIVLSLLRPHPLS